LYDKMVKVIPKNIVFSNYQEAVRLINYWRTLLNTFSLGFLVAILQAVSCTLVGYGFARYNFKGKNILFVLVIISMVIPPQIILTSLYANFLSLGMIGNFSPFIALSATATYPRCGLYTFLARQYFKGIPKEIDEAASIDGAGPYKVFLLIMLKSAVPMVVTIFLFSFVWQWNDTTYSYMFNPNISLIAGQLDNLGYTMLQMLSGVEAGASASNIGYLAIMRATATLLAILPLLVLYAISQKFFVQSVERAGIVG